MPQQRSADRKLSVLMAIPRNLVYIFICAIVGAFLGMAYIVYFDIDINQFTPNFSFNKVDVSVHPLYLHLQKLMPVRDENVSKLNAKNVGQKTFYQYVKNSEPLVIEEAAKNWQVTEEFAKDPSTKYLEESFNNHLQIGMLRKFDNGTYYASKFHKNSLMQYSEFKKLFSKDLKQFKVVHEGMFFIDNSILRPNDLIGAYKKPEFSNMLEITHIGYSQFSKNYEKRKATYSENERLICGFDGTEVFKLVSPIYTQNMYVGLFDEFAADEVPIDLYFATSKKYPLWKDVVSQQVQLEPGQCLYIPAFWWVQTRTKSKVSRMIEFDFTANNQVFAAFIRNIYAGHLVDPL